MLSCGLTSHTYIYMYVFFPLGHLLNIILVPSMQDFFSSTSPSSCKVDEYHPPLYRQGESSSKVGYFKTAHVKINSDEIFQDFLETYSRAILSGVCMKQMKEGSIYEPCSEVAKAGEESHQILSVLVCAGFHHSHVPRMSFLRIGVKL